MIARLYLSSFYHITRDKYRPTEARKYGCYCIVSIYFEKRLRNLVLLPFVMSYRLSLLLQLANRHHPFFVSGPQFYFLGSFVLCTIVAVIKKSIWICHLDREPILTQIRPFPIPDQSRFASFFVVFICDMSVDKHLAPN